MAAEQAYSGDGSFYGRRLAALAEANPYYYTRLESDRACVLGMALAWAPLVKSPPPPAESFERSVAGGWIEPEHGAAMHRSPTRLASFAWRARGLGQGLCLPPDDGHLAEWQGNLCGAVRFPCDSLPVRAERALRSARVAAFPGGFLACGQIVEGAKVHLPEGWIGENQLLHFLCFAALPDDRTVAAIELMRTGPGRVYLTEVQGMHFVLPNDLYNGFERRVTGEQGEMRLRTPAPAGVLDLISPWVNLDGRIGLAGLYGAESLRVARADERRAGFYPSLYVEEFAWGGWRGTRAVEGGATVLDVGWAAASGVDAPATRDWARAQPPARSHSALGPVRQMEILGFDGRRYVLAANFGEARADIELPPATDCLTGAAAGGMTTLEGGQGGLFVRA